jgi:hypothetical protein
MQVGDAQAQSVSDDAGCALGTSMLEGYSMSLPPES